VRSKATTQSQSSNLPRVKIRPNPHRFEELKQAKRRKEKEMVQIRINDVKAANKVEGGAYVEML
jgi:hypothetical protein